MPDTLTIRLATRADLLAVDALLARSYPRLLAPDYPPSVLVTALRLIARAKPKLVNSGHYFVAVNAAGDVVGAGGCTPASPPGRGGLRGVADLRHVITDHRHVRQGIGSRLMAEVIAHVRALDAGLVDCLATRTAVRSMPRSDSRRLARWRSRCVPGAAFRRFGCKWGCKRKRAGALHRPEWSVEPAAPYSRAPRNWSRNMNMLMKSR